MIQPDHRVAVLLNPNAKRVSPQIRGAIASVVAPEDIFVSHSESEAQTIARTVVARGYETVFTGGGDGTFMGFVNHICDCIGTTHLPRFGILRLGTGNALASLVGASPARGGGIINDLVRTRAGEIRSIFELDLIEAEGLRCPFAGLGADAHIINAYAAVKSRYKWLGRYVQGSLGYGIAVATRSFPHYLRRRRLPEIEVLNTGSTAFRIDSSGEPVGPAIEYGEVLYRGPALIAAGSTMPLFGFDLRFFPFAGKRRANMHLRIFAGSTLGVVAHLPRTFRGTYFPKGVHDFYCQSVHIRASEPMPMERGGDPCGERTELDLSIADRSIELVSFRNRAAA